VGKGSVEMCMPGEANGFMGVFSEADVTRGSSPILAPAYAVGKPAPGGGSGSRSPPYTPLTSIRLTCQTLPGPLEARSHLFYTLNAGLISTP
jgi:hypothetical protein